MEDVSIDLGAAEACVDSVGSAVFSFLSEDVIANVVLVVGAFLCLWFVYRVVRWLKDGSLEYVDNVDERIVRDYESGNW